MSIKWEDATRQNIQITAHRGIKDLIPEGEYYTDAQGELHLSE